MISVPVFLYSKYCKECPIIMRAVDPNQMVFLCVDNVDIRKKILTDQKFTIRKVPSLLVYNDRYSSFEKYEGSEQVVEWLSENNLLQEEEPESEDRHPSRSSLHLEEPLPQDIIQSPPPMPQNRTLQNNMVSMPTIAEIDSEDAISPTREIRTNPELSTPPPLTENTESEQQQSMSDPSGMSDSSGMTDPSNANDIISKKSNNILNLAQQMQRERESSEDRSQSKV